jgi:predicted DNA-binding ribbon-helix-helix protein
MELNPSRKRSVIVCKRRTSISLEDSFCFSLQAIVRMENITVGDFVEKISRQRSTLNLSSSLRVAVLEYFQQLTVNSIAVCDDIEPTLLPHQAGATSCDNQQQILERIASFSNRTRRRCAPRVHSGREMER